jgi:uncharacterized HAD superfamily protein
MFRISFDLDGVLYPWQEVVYDEFFSKVMGEERKFEQFWKDWEDIPHSTFEALSLNNRYYDTDKTHNHVPFILHTISQWAEIYYITARPSSAFISTQRWIYDNWFPYTKNLFLTKNKREVIEYHRIKMHIDDLPANGNDVADITEFVLLERPWNVGKRDGFKTVKNLTDVIELVRERVVG